MSKGFTRDICVCSLFHANQRYSVRCDFFKLTFYRFFNCLTVFLFVLSLINFFSSHCVYITARIITILTAVVIGIADDSGNFHGINFRFLTSGLIHQNLFFNSLLRHDHCTIQYLAGKNDSSFPWFFFAQLHYLSILPDNA